MPDTFLSSLNKSLHALFDNDEATLMIGEDILDPYGGAFKVTKGLSTKYPDRVITTPICENSIVGAGVGLALRGFRPIVEIMFGDFITLACDQLINEAAKFELMFGQDVTVPLVLRTAVGGGRGYGPTHSQSLEKIILGTPNLVVVAPSLYHSPGQELVVAVKDPRPVVFLEHKLLYPIFLKNNQDNVSKLGEDEHGYSIAHVANYDRSRQSADIVLITYGGVSRFLDYLLTALEEDEIWIDVIIFSCISHVNIDPIIPFIEHSGRLVIAEEGTAGFGWGAEIASRVYAQLYRTLKAPIKCVAADDNVIPSSFVEEQKMIVSTEKILNAIMQVMG